MAALLVVAFFANLMMRPVREKHHYRESDAGMSAVPGE